MPKSATTFTDYFKISMTRAGHGYIRSAFPLHGNPLIAAPTALAGMTGAIIGGYLAVAFTIAFPAIGLGLFLTAGACGAALNKVAFKDEGGTAIAGFAKGLWTPVYIGTGAGLLTGALTSITLYSAAALPVFGISGVLRAPVDWALDKTGLAKYVPQKKQKFYNPLPKPLSGTAEELFSGVFALTSKFNRDPMVVMEEKIKALKKKGIKIPENF